MKNRIVALMLWSLLAAGPATGQEENEATPAEGMASTNRYIGVLGTYLQPDDVRAAEVDSGNGVGFLFGSQWANGLGWEVNLFADLIETGKNRGTDFYRQNLGLDLFYAFGNREKFTPFVLVGAGYARNDVFPDDRDDEDWLANAGVGFVTGPFVFDLFRLRGEVRYIHDNFEQAATDYRAGLGLEFPIYRKVIVRDAEDKVQVVEVYTGLSDSDGDGVVDNRDNCPDTPAGDRVDGSGCTLPKVMALKGVSFEFNSSRLQPDSRKILGDIVGILKRYPDMQVEIAGHTDWIGSDEYNQRLSLSRAQSVQNFLLEQGAAQDQLTAAGYGEAEPVATNDTDEGRELNRRVEMRILN